MGIVVAKTEYGYLVKTFNNIKGLLTFAEYKSSGDGDKELLPGAVVKSYVMWNKKKAGLALTLNKKKARKADAGDGTASKSLLTDFTPTGEVANAIFESMSQLKKYSKEIKNNPVLTWRVVEDKGSFYLLKTVESSKQKFGVLPKCLANSFGIARQFHQADFTFEGVVI